ncbi:MAG: trypsin-like peptidase domain-containing protein [Pseudonocardia sp.]
MSGEIPVRGATGPERTCVAELIVRSPDGERRGCGYRVNAGAVLTAAHVVVGATEIRVRFDADLQGEWTTSTTSWWTDPRSDVAVLTIAPPAGGTAPAMAAFGRVGDRAAVLPVQAVGFPRWKLRNDDGPVPADGDGRSRFRDAHQAHGSVAILSNWREGSLEVAVDAAPGATGAEDGSPWEGFSGAALWSAGRIIGIVARHHPGDGISRLSAVRLDRMLDELDPGSLDELRALVPALPARAGLLPDVVPIPAHETTATAYRAQLEDIAPDHVQDRDDELAELVRFCAGDAAYAWLQAAPWAGKTALLSWFALHPPAGVDVVSFFVTGRFAGQSDGEAFTEALLEQLAVLADEPVAPALEASARRGHLLRLLRAATFRSRAAGRRLLLIVDGLDEDSGPGAGRPSILSLLPRRLPPGAQLLLSSRPTPGIPDDVATDHPLRTLRPRPLTASPHARDVELAAKNELSQLLNGPDLQRDVLGLITAAGGGLSRADLEELTGRAPYELERLLDGRFGRSLTVRPDTTAGGTGDGVHLLAHESLRETAERSFGASLGRHRNAVHAWADGYRARRWPPSTPTYLLRSYPRMLTATGDAARLVSMATDRDRHDRMLDITGGDALAAAEIAAATTLLRRERRPDLGGLLLLAIARDDLDRRNRSIPAELPAVWTALGRVSRASSLAAGIADEPTRVRAFASMIRRAARAGELTSARRLATTAVRHARSIGSPVRRSQAMADLAVAIASGSAADADRDLAWGLTDEIPSVALRVRVLAELATAEGPGPRAAQLLDIADRLVPRLSQPTQQADVLCAIATALVALGRVDSARRRLRAAERLLRDLPDEGLRADATAKVAAGLVATGAERAVEDLLGAIPGYAARVDARARVAAAAAAGDPALALRVAREITEPGRREETLAAVIGQLAAGGDLDRADALIAEIEDPAWRVEALGHLAAAAVQAGQAGRARRVIATAERLALSIPDDQSRAEGLAGLVRAAAAVDPERAERYARAIPNPASRAQALTELADVLAGPSATPPTRERAMALATAAEEVARLSRDPRWRVRTVIRLVGPAVAADDPRRAALLAETARRLAHQVSQHEARAYALADLAAEVAAHLGADRALRVVTDAEQVMTEVPYPDARAHICTWLAEVAAAAKDRDRALRLVDAAEEIVERSENLGWRVQQLRRLAIAAARAGDDARALVLARDITDPTIRAGVLLQIATGGPGADAARTERARPDDSSVQMLAEVLCTPEWTTALRAVADLDPAAIRTVSDLHLGPIAEDDGRGPRPQA